MPLISVILPTCNRPSLKEALLSLERQTFKDFEVIVINDGGKNLENLLVNHQNLNIKYIELQKTQGPARARNEGLKQAKSKYIAYLDDDDIYYPTHLEVILKGLLEGKRVVYTKAKYQYLLEIDDKNIVLEEEVYGQEFDREKLFLANYIPTPNIAHEKNLLEKVGYFDENLLAHEDWDLWIRLALTTDFYYIPETTTEIRIKKDEKLFPPKREKFLKTLKIIYSRYSHLVSNSIINQQRSIEKNFLFEIFLYQLDPYIGRIIKDYLHKNERFFLSLTQEQRKQIEKLKAEVKKLEEKNIELIKSKNREIKKLENKIRELSKTQEQLNKERERLIEKLKSTENNFREKEEELHKIYTSLGWNYLLVPTYKILNALLPVNTKRRVLAKIFLKALMNPQKTYYQINRQRIKKFFYLVRNKEKNELESLFNRLLDEEKQTKIDEENIWYRFEEKKEFYPKVSVIVPNYNHYPFLSERLESIYNQTYPNLEVILLDDASQDGSKFILKRFAEQYPNHTICLFNEENSGNVFMQWKKGLSLASGDLIWIAESDDFCDKNFLERLVPFFKNPAIMLAFCKTEFVDAKTKRKIWSLEEYLSDIIRPQYWQKDFIETSHNLVNSIWSKKNIIPNVSSTIFRNPGKAFLEENTYWTKFQLCGDWIFYLLISKGGLIAYTPQTTNYYRIHSQNTSIKTYKEDTYYKEHFKVAEFIIKNFKIKFKEIEKQKEIVKKHWIIHRKENQQGFEKIYKIENLKQFIKKRKPNILMAVYAFTSGGGEVFAIRLANKLKSRGYSITILNLNQDKKQEDFLKIIRQDIPIVEIQQQDDLCLIKNIINNLGIEIVHSHHAWSDTLFAELLKDNKECKLIVTLHGMYEMMPEKHFKSIIPKLQRVDKFVYLSEKNLRFFKKFSFPEEKFIKIYNAIEPPVIRPVSRKTLGISNEAFVVCIASRAIPEKGWQEAIEIIQLIRKKTKKDVHLLLIGNGPEYDRLKKKDIPNFIHLLGFKRNVCDYFASSNLGLLPSKFSGETFPLTVIECLYANRPIVASNLGEIKNMISTPKGLAGDIFKLKNFKIPIKEVAEIIIKYLDKNYYNHKKELTKEAIKKFDFEDMFKKYEKTYLDTLKHFSVSS